MSEFELKSHLFDLRKSFGENMVVLIDDMNRGNLINDRLLAETIKSGNATDEPSEVDMLYDRFPVLMDIIHDLAVLYRYPYHS